MKLVKHKSLFVEYFKYLPAISTLILTIHVGLLLLGIDLHVTLFLVDSSLLNGTMLVLSSIIFNMCTLHKASIWYTILITICIDFLREIGFGNMLIPMRWIALSIGVVLCILLLCKHVRKVFSKDTPIDCRRCGEW